MIKFKDSLIILSFILEIITLRIGLQFKLLSMLMSYKDSHFEFTKFIILKFILIKEY